MTTTIHRLDFAAEQLSAVIMDAADLVIAEQDVWHWLGKETIFYGTDEQIIAEWENLLDQAVRMPAAYAEIMEDVSELVHEVNREYLTLICES